MENIDYSMPRKTITDRINTKSRAKSSVLQSLARGMLFKLLNFVEKGGITIVEKEVEHHFGPDKSQAVIQVNHPEFFTKSIFGGSIGASEAYFLGYWDSPDVTKVIEFICDNMAMLDKLEGKFAWLSAISKTMHKIFDKNTKAGSKDNIMAHYDLSNELYTRFLDETMMYSSADFGGQDLSLHQASLNKLRLTCERLNIQPGDQILEIGTGWGGMAIYMASNYDCHVTTTTISEAQYQFAKNKINKLGLQNKITLLRSDYRDLDGKYDKLVSIEMIEAVGHEFLEGYFKQCDRLLKPGGRFVLQSILIDHSRYHTYKNDVDFIQKYIFPGGALPSDTIVRELVGNHTQMAVHQQHDFGLDYAKTLEMWRLNFNQKWHEIKEFGFDETFRRLWNYYFHYCEGGFNKNAINVAQFVMVKPSH